VGLVLLCWGREREEIVVGGGLDLWWAIQVQSEFRRGNRVRSRNEMSRGQAWQTGAAGEEAELNMGNGYLKEKKKQKAREKTAL
jgi:hypothetical protein